MSGYYFYFEVSRLLKGSTIVKFEPTLKNTYQLKAVSGKNDFNIIFNPCFLKITKGMSVLYSNIVDCNTELNDRYLKTAEGCTILGLKSIMPGYSVLKLSGNILVHCMIKDNWYKGSPAIYCESPNKLSAIYLNRDGSILFDDSDVPLKQQNLKYTWKKNYLDA